MIYAKNPTTVITCSFRCQRIKHSCHIATSQPTPTLALQSQLKPELCAQFIIKNNIQKMAFHGSCLVHSMQFLAMWVLRIFKTSQRHTDIAYCCTLFALLLPSVGFRFCLLLQLCMQINGRSRRARTMAVLIWKVAAATPTAATEGRVGRKHFHFYFYFYFRILQQPQNFPCEYAERVDICGLNKKQGNCCKINRKLHTNLFRVRQCFPKSWPKKCCLNGEATKQRKINYLIIFNWLIKFVLAFWIWARFKQNPKSNESRTLRALTFVFFA